MDFGILNIRKLELQKYSASWNYVKKLKEFHKEFLQIKNSLMFTKEDVEYRLLPSKFDCDYAFILMYICYHILATSMNGYLTDLINLMDLVKNWHCGAAPMTTMMIVMHWFEKLGALSNLTFMQQSRILKEKYMICCEKM